MTDKNQESMSDERLAEIRARLDRTPVIPFATDKTEPGVARVRMSDLRWAVYSLIDLANEVERLRQFVSWVAAEVPDWDSAVSLHQAAFKLLGREQEED